MTINGKNTPEILASGKALNASESGCAQSQSRQLTLARFVRRIINNEPMLIIKYYISNKVFDLSTTEWELTTLRASVKLTQGEARMLLHEAREAERNVTCFTCEYGIVYDINFFKLRMKQDIATKVINRVYSYENTPKPKPEVMGVEEKAKQTRREYSKTYRDRKKNDEAWLEHRREYQREWKRQHKEKQEARYVVLKERYNSDPQYRAYKQQLSREYQRQKRAEKKLSTN